MLPSPQSPIRVNSNENHTGNLRTATLLADALIGPVILSLPWTMAQLGWVLGPIMTVLFSIVTCVTTLLLAHCSRAGGSRNHDYINTVKSSLGVNKTIIFDCVISVFVCGIVIEFTKASYTSMSAICWSLNGADSSTVENLSMFLFGIVQILLSQTPNVNQYRPVITAKIVLFFIYSLISIGLSIAQVAETGNFSGSLTGVKSASTVSATMIWRRLYALGIIEFGYTFPFAIFAIQDTIKSSPTEANTMEMASMTGIGTITIFYMICGFGGYAAFGDSVPANILTAFGSYKLVNIAHLAIFMHLTASYQGYCQPFFLFIEKLILERFPNNIFIRKEIKIPIPRIQSYNLNLFCLVWRSIFVMITVVIPKFVPYSSEAVGLIQALGFWILSVYFPIEMYIALKQIPKRSIKWVFLQILNFCVLIITIAMVTASVALMILDFKP